MLIDSIGLDYGIWILSYFESWMNFIAILIMIWFFIPYLIEFGTLFMGPKGNIIGMVNLMNRLNREFSLKFGCDSKNS